MNAVQVLTKDHRAVKTLFAEFEAVAADQRADVLARIIRELSVHAAIEAAHLSPVVAEELSTGEYLVEESDKEHQGIKARLAWLDGKLDKAHTNEVAEQLARLKEPVEHHV